MSTFSYSKIGAFETCRLQYKYAYIDHIEVEAEDTVETFLGTRIHETLEKLYRDKQFEKLISLEELLEFYNRKWQEKWHDKIIVVKKEYSLENYRKMGERHLADYYNRYKPFDRGKVIGLETKNLLSLDKEGNYKFHVRIDRLMDMGDGLYEVHDYKSGSTLPKQEKLDEDKQLAMYSLWVGRQFKDFKKARLVWHFLAFDKELDSFRTKKQLEDLRKEVLAKIKEIESTEEFHAKVSWLCDWCLYKGICPMWTPSKTPMARHEGRRRRRSRPRSTLMARRSPPGRGPPVGATVPFRAPGRVRGKPGPVRRPARASSRPRRRTRECRERSRGLHETTLSPAAGVPMASQGRAQWLVRCFPGRQ